MKCGRLQLDANATRMGQTQKTMKALVVVML
jgi:hypothetical protein